MASKPKYHTHISAKQRWFELNLKQVWDYRDLIMLFTKRNFVVSYKQTILGPAWMFINPIITSLIYTFVFGGIAGIGTGGVPQMLFYLSGNAIWSFFASSLTGNANTFTGNAGIFGKVYFPRLTVPVSNILTSLISFGVQMIMVIIFWAYYIIKGNVTPNYWALLLIPLILIHLGVMGMSFGIVISSLTTKYRDLNFLVGFGVQLWMYATPVVYPLSQLEDGFMKTILMINPVTAPVELFRYALLGSGEILPLYMGISIAFTVVVLIGGVVVFNRVEKTFMDTV